MGPTLQGWGLRAPIRISVAWSRCGYSARTLCTSWTAAEPSPTADATRFIDSEREALLRLRAEGAIDDDVLRALERELDLDERRVDS